MGADMSDRQIQILLVEDNPNDVKLALHAFKTHNLVNCVHVVRDGAEALEFIFGTGRYADRDVASSPKLVLLDLKLPLVDGIDVLRRIKSDERTSMIPVVVMTSSNVERDIVESYKLGVNSYIRKPVDFNQFTEAVRQLGCYWLLLNEIPPCAIPAADSSAIHVSVPSPYPPAESRDQISIQPDAPSAT
jgi:two-component system response regulator